MALVTINFSGATTGVSFTAGGTVAAFLNANPTLPISVSATVAADNLTSVGLLSAGGNTVWRIENFGSADSATLVKVGGGFSTSLSVPANSFTFVRGGSAGTYILTTSAGSFTKASGPQINTIQTLALADSYNITGSNFNDTLFGGQNADTLIGGLGDDHLNGQQQNDFIDGGAGNDSLIGGGQNDTLIGGAGNDTLFGGAQNDTLTGGAGADRFAYDNTNQGVDTITDFSTAQVDLIQISASGTGFSGSGLVAGLLPGTQFFSSATAGPGSGDANTRFIYNTTNGNLWFDRDGTGATASVQLATLTGAPAAFDHSYIIIV
ncbi:calcium-binding protein [Microcystis aeruginosa]|uniref:calcium-binding protein n=1 Tax=Microcystis aeruginosa TaxID=1126 RepID=UPI00187FB79E|nr:calcium-binding protein [Microcystis aeruginosa]MBE8995132.1 calcium-binding protein [Microcystis aeruginosa LEGE 91341]